MRWTFSCVALACSLVALSSASADEGHLDPDDGPGASRVSETRALDSVPDLTWARIRVAEQPGWNEPDTWQRRPGSQLPPPMPPREGVGAIVTGWIMFGGGALFGTTMGIAWLSSSTFEGESDESRRYRILSLTGGAVAGIGLALAIHGHIRLRRSRHRRRVWQSQYGFLDLGDTTLVPVAYKDGSGVMLTGSF